MITIDTGIYIMSFISGFIFAFIFFVILGWVFILRKNKLPFKEIKNDSK